MIIKSRSQKLPEKITIYNTERKINILKLRIKFCNSCQSFGHTNYNNSCNNELICRNCGKNHNIENGCNEKTNCKNCNKNHFSNFNVCEKYKLNEKIIIETMYNNKTYEEAKQMFKPKESYSILNQDFPDNE